MEIKVAKHAGFCFGVRRAVETLVAEQGNHRIFTLGKLIHNPHVVERLEDAGVQVLSEENIFEIAATATAERPVVIVIRAHGTLRPIMERLTAMSAENPSLSVIDCTCPFVKKIHTIVERETSPRRSLVVSGDPGNRDPENEV